MKTLKEVTKEIERLEADGSDKTLSDSNKNSIRKKLKLLRLCKKYLEFNPTIDSVKLQLKNVKSWLKIHEDRFIKWVNAEEKRKELYDPRKVFFEAHEIDEKEIKKWRSEVKFLNHLLSE